jgi:SAM-dependent methyltransferase
VTQHPTNDDVRAAWDENASYWDARLVQPDSWQQTIVFPVVLGLLDLAPGERVLEVACGNGLLAQRMADAGVEVLATDFSEEQMRFAAGRITDPKVTLAEADVTARDALASLGVGFDAVVCSMALMDISDIEPLAGALPSLLRPGGRFVFSVTHPAFNNMSLVHVKERRMRGNVLVDELSVRVSRYASGENRPGHGDGGSAGAPAVLRPSARRAPAAVLRGGTRDGRPGRAGVRTRDGRSARLRPGVHRDPAHPRGSAPPSTAWGG